MKGTLPFMQYEKRVYPFPIDPLERVGNILAAYNASPKALTQLLITSTPVTRLELSKRFAAVVADTALELSDSYNANGYCRDSLCPLGLVVQEKMPSSGRYPYVITFSLTDAGIMYGRPAAAAFLAFEKKYGFSLFPMLCPTSSIRLDDAKHKLTRAMLLCELTKGTRRTNELAMLLHCSETVITRSLSHLADAGAITYQTLNIRTQETQVIFSLAKTAMDHVVIPVGGYTKLTSLVVEACNLLHNRHVPITQISVSTILRKKQKESIMSKPMSKKVSEILSGLVKQGYLDRQQFSRNIKSIATITAKGQCVVENLIKPLMDAMRDSPPLERWQRTILPTVQNHLSDYAEQSAALYYPFSKSRDKIDRADSLALLQKLLQTGNSNTVSQLARKLRVNQMTVSAYLRKFETMHRISKKTLKGVAYYSMAKKDT